MQLVPLSVPEEPAELQPLLLSEAQHVFPRDARRVQLVLGRLPDVPEVRFIEEPSQGAVAEAAKKGLVPDGIGHLLAQGAFEEVGPLG